MSQPPKTEHFKVIVIGGGHAGLSVGYHLAHRIASPFLILDANARIGDSWRKRWDSLRLFSPARYSALDGMPFPGAKHAFPTKDEMADYLEAYAAQSALPVRTGVQVDRLYRENDRYVIMAGERRFEADNVVVAMANYQKPWVPPLAGDLDPKIRQLHSGDYRNPSQLHDGAVLIVGAGNSGSEIALEAAAHGHKTWISGRHPDHVPFRIEGFWGRHVLVPFVLRFVKHRLLTTNTPMGRKIRPRMISQGGPLVRIKPEDLAAAGVERVGKTIAVHRGFPVLEDGSLLDAANVIWCTGFQPDFSWIELPIVDKFGEPLHERGVVASAPGFYFVGLHFLYALSSAMIHGVGRDAKYVADHIARRVAAGERPSDAGNGTVMLLPSDMRVWIQRGY
jgi:putative flavoprotein involved in K+ transport